MLFLNCLHIAFTVVSVGPRSTHLNTQTLTQNERSYSSSRPCNT